MNIPLKFENTILTKRLTILGCALGLCACVSLALTDSDNDGMDDSWESFFGVNPGTNNAVLDPDGDSLNNLAESSLWSDPFVADTDRDGFQDGADSNPVSRAVMPWGDDFFTRTNEVVYAWPDWMVSAYKTGGEWQAAPACWWVPASETGFASLNVEVDRDVLTNDLRLRLPLAASPGAALYLDLYDPDECVVASNLCGGNLLADVGTGLVKTLNVPLETFTNAVGLRLRREAGAVAVGETVAYVDLDGDGLDADQERQLGTSDTELDSDHDGFGDYEEVFTYGTDPASALSVPRGPVRNPVSEPRGSIDSASLFVECFEPNTVTVGDLNGQNGWLASPAHTALVQTNTVWEGRHAVSWACHHDCTASVERRFATPHGQALWVDFWTQPARTPPPTGCLTNDLAVFYFDAQRHLVGMDGQTNGLPHWVTFTNGPAVAFGQWVRVTIHFDFAAQRWFPCLDGVRLAEGLAFGRPGSELREFEATGASGTLDALCVTASQPSGLSLAGDFDAGFRGRLAVRSAVRGAGSSKN